MANLEEIGARARAAGRRLALMPTERKNAALEAIAFALLDETNVAEVLAANAADVAAGRDAGLSPALIDRMTLTPQRLAAIASDTRAVAHLPDPVGERFDATVLENGLRVHKTSRAARCRWGYLRSAPERDSRCRRALPEIRQCGNPARRQGNYPFVRGVDTPDPERHYANRASRRCYSGDRQPGPRAGRAVVAP